MIKNFSLIIVVIIAIFYSALCLGQTITPDLKAATEGKGWKGNIDAAKVIENGTKLAVEFNRFELNIIWLDGFDFKEGTIEFDAKGKSAPPQSSFIGIAFRVVDSKTHDAVYFRPFNFRANDPERKAHAVQYISEPTWSWEKLRSEKPGQFEKPIDPAPDGDAWFHVKIILEDKQVKVFVNNADLPSLVVNELSKRTGGSIGLWCNGYGMIAHLKITPKK